MAHRGLTPAHKGYIFQDAAISLLLLRHLPTTFKNGLIDAKLFKGDAFDDLSLEVDGISFRCQYKSGSTKAFEETDLSTSALKARVDSLIQSFKKSPPAYQAYRLCTTRTTPTDAATRQLLKPIAQPPFLPNSGSSVFSLNAEEIWPIGVSPKWRILQKGISRSDFQKFCNHFYIELGCLPASCDLNAPGELEAEIIRFLREGIGVGIYPNQDLNPIDSASRIIQLVTSARANQTAVTPNRIIEELRLRTDYGRISQSFPVVQDYLVGDTALYSQLKSSLQDNKITQLIGPPGSGKSWALTELGRELASPKVIVARHYCYLEPGDPFVQLRITTERAISNLIGELLDQFPVGAQLNRPLYSAGIAQLEQLLASITKEGKQVVLIIDGLDHIARVLADAKDVAPGETDIIDELSMLNLPDGAAIVIGSQPGTHLAPITGTSFIVTLPSWPNEKIYALTEKLGLNILLPGPQESKEASLKVLADTADGNPLYATFLTRELIFALQSGQAIDPPDFLKQLPKGDITAYYTYLLKSINPQASSVVNLLGTIDFGVTIDELQAIFKFPIVANLIKETITQLRPILTNISSQGGIRIYHESFRRYILEEFKSKGISIPDTLAPLILWLETRGFFTDSKSYRFLLPCLRRADRGNEILKLVSHDFVSHSLEAGHPRAPIEANLQIAISVAVELLSWASIASLTELHRAVATCFEEKLQDYKTYGMTFAQLFGAEALMERLQFDGKPTHNYANGLLLCSVCDDLGVRPPWQIYLELIDSSRKSEDVDVELARFHGLVRTIDKEELFRRVSTWIQRYKSPPDKYFHGILARLAKSYGAEYLIRLLRTKGVTNHVYNRIARETAKQLRRENHRNEAQRLLNKTLEESKTHLEALECLRHGASPKHIPNLDFTLSAEFLTADMVEYEDSRIENWISKVGVLAHLNIRKLQAHKLNISRSNWYSGWLWFIIELAIAEAKAHKTPKEAEKRAIAAFLLLAEDTAPFKGDPRVCDLYKLHPIIVDSISRCADLIQTSASWKRILPALEKITNETTSFLQNSASGPLPPEEYCRLLVSKMNPSNAKLLCHGIRKIVKEAPESGYFSEVLATHEMFLTQALLITNDKTEAEIHWKKACTLFSAYGYRKDITIFELIETIPDLYLSNPGWGRTAIKRTQNLINAVLAHTDGKETRHAPDYWFESILKCDQKLAMNLLAHSLSRHGGRINYHLEDALRKIIKDCESTGNPLVLAFLKSTLLDGETETSVERSFNLLSRIKTHYPHLLQNLTQILLAEIEGDSPTFDDKTFKSAIQKAHSLGVQPNGTNYPFPEAPSKTKEEFLGSTKPKDQFKFPIFSSDTRPSDILTTIRQLSRFSTDKENQEQLANALGFRLLELAQNNHKDEAERVLLYFSRDYYTYSESASVLADLGDGFERYGFKDLSALAFTLAYARSRGNGGWLALGGKEHLHWLTHANSISASITQTTLAREIGKILESQTYVIGITRRLVEFGQLWLTPQQQIEVWEAAYKVINHRLPESQADDGAFLEFKDYLVPNLSVDELLTQLLIVRVSHPEIERKRTALAGLKILIATEPSLISGVLPNALKQDSPLTSLRYILQLILDTEPAPYIITQKLKAGLSSGCRSDEFILRHLSTSLLRRIGIKTSPVLNPIPPKPTFQSAERTRITLTLDKGRRIPLLARIWDEFPPRIASRFETLFNLPQNKARVRNRHTAASSRSQKNIPETRFLFWEDELFELALSEILDPLDSILFSQGNWSEKNLQQLLTRLLPDLENYHAHWSSRTTRPIIPRPSQTVAGTFSVDKLSDSGDYKGWYRIALWEEEFVFDTATYPKVIGTTETYSGVILSPHGPLGNGVPLGIGSAEIWSPPPFTGSITPPPTNSPLATIYILGGQFGVHHILGLPPGLSSQLGLTRGANPRFELVDSNNNPAAVYRHWKVKPLGNEIDEETPTLKGADLIISPNTMARCFSICGGKMRMETQVEDKPLSR